MYASSSNSPVTGAGSSRSVKLARCGSCSSPRCIRARPSPTSASSWRIWSGSSSRSDTRSSGRCSTRGAAGRSATWGSRRATARAARRFRPDVVYAHFLVPTGLWGALLGRAPLVVTAHGQDVANIGRIPGVRAATRLVVRRASAVIAVSDYLRQLLEERVPEARGKTEVIDCGVDLERFRPLRARRRRATRLSLRRRIERAQERRCGSRAPSSGSARDR